MRRVLGLVAAGREVLGTMRVVTLSRGYKYPELRA